MTAPDPIPLASRQAATTTLDVQQNVALCLNLSHEMRTPIHAVLGHVELLLGGCHGPLSSEMRGSLADIQAAGLALSVQIDRMIAVAEGITTEPGAAATIVELERLIEQAWRQSRSARVREDQQQRMVCSPRHAPTADRRLHLLAILLADCGAVRPASCSLDSSSDMNRADADHASNLHLYWPGEDRGDGMAHLTLIDATMRMLGGKARLEADRLELAW